MVGCSAPIQGRRQRRGRDRTIHCSSPLDASPDWADMQDDASNAFNELLRRPLCEESSAHPAFRPFLCVATMLYGRPSKIENRIAYNYTSINRLLSLGPPCLANVDS
jgi:hypothetical protein